MTQDERDWQASHRQTAGSGGTNPVAMARAGSGGGSSSSPGLDPNLMEQLKVQSELGNREADIKAQLGNRGIDAQFYSSDASKQAAMYAAFMNASISRVNG